MIEILTFRLASTTEDSVFRAVDARVQTEVAYQQPGLLRRTTGRDSDGRWLVLQVWENAEAASSGRAALDESEVGREFESMIDAATARLERFDGLD